MSKYEKEIKQLEETGTVKVDYGNFEVEFSEELNKMVYDIVYKGLNIETYRYLEDVKELMEKYEYYPIEYFEDKLLEVDKRIKKVKIKKELREKLEDMFETSKDIVNIITMYEESFKPKEDEFLLRQNESTRELYFLEDAIHMINKHRNKYECK